MRLKPRVALIGASQRLEDLALHVRASDWLAESLPDVAALRDAPWPHADAIVLDEATLLLPAALAEARAVVPAGWCSLVPWPVASTSDGEDIHTLLAKLGRAIACLRPELVHPVLSFAGIVSDRVRHMVWCDNVPVPLEERSFEMLRVFLAHPDRLLTRQELHRRVSMPTRTFDPASTTAYVNRLRRALSVDSRGSPIRTVRGGGYILSDPASSQAMTLPGQRMVLAGAG